MLHDAKIIGGRYKKEKISISAYFNTLRIRGKIMKSTYVIKKIKYNNDSKKKTKLSYSDEHCALPVNPLHSDPVFKQYYLAHTESNKIIVIF